MGKLCYAYTSSTSFTVPTDTKCICYISVGGGGGGAYPQQVVGNSPQPGGYTQFSAGGTSFGYAGGGGYGNYSTGGAGGYGTYAYGQTGYMNYSGGGSARAASGYGPFGSGGAGQWRSPNQSAGGGGGGASQTTIARGNSGAIPGQSVSWTVGCGGRQGGTGTCRYGASGAVYMWVCTYDPPIPSISAVPTAFRANGTDGSDGTVDLTWSTSGGESDSEVLERLDLANNVVESYGQVNRNQSTPFVVSPTESSQFRITVSNPAYTRTDSVTVYVYQEPVVTFISDAVDDTIIQGQSVNLTWSVTGDADSIFITPGIGQSVLSSSQQVSPSVTTTYTASASGLGGTGSAELTITVLPPPTISVSGPVNVLWGENIPISIEATNSDGGISYVATYYFTDGTFAIQDSVDIPNSIGDEVNIQAYDVVVNYDSTLPLPLGPSSVEIVFSVDGYGTLSDTDTLTIPIIIDQLPNAIDIPETDDAIKDENPVITPDVEVTSVQIVIDDIDIPVEIKSDYPIQVEIDNDDNFRDVRQI